jgi:hypothetical protein
MRLHDGGKKRPSVGDIGDAAARQVHTGVGVAAIEGEAASPEVGELTEGRRFVHDEHAGMGSTRTMFGRIDGRAEHGGLPPINGLEWVAAHLREEGVGFDFRRHRSPLEIDKTRYILQTKPRQFESQCGPE